MYEANVRIHGELHTHILLRVHVCICLHAVAIMVVSHVGTLKLVHNQAG